jgi:predicted flap endonuclease-1-like 5' DNA nuclease
MRSDYLLYLLALLFFAAAAVSANLEMELAQKSVWVLINVVLGFVSAGFGYHYRPRTLPTFELGDVHIKEAHIAEGEEKHAEPTVEPLSTTPIPMQEVAPIPLPAPAPEPVTVVAPLVSELTEIRGISEKRKQQLQALGVNTVEDLANASAEDLAKNLAVSPKITRMWIGSAKKLKK